MGLYFIYESFDFKTYFGHLFIFVDAAAADDDDDFVGGGGGGN